MKMQKQAIMFPRFLLLIIVLLFLHSSSTSAEEAGEYDYKQESGKGPGHWGNLKKEWAACNNGHLQSPIDLVSSRVKVIPKSGNKLQTNYISCHATIQNRGHDIALSWAGNAGSILVNGVVYNLQNSHWHSPSEHTINGQRYDLEVHMVHKTSDPKVKNNIAVVGQLYKIGEPDHFLSLLTGNISSMTETHNIQREMGVMNPQEINLGGGMHYRYLGSLTVPPCTEGVIWTINTKINTVSREQVEVLRMAVKAHGMHNARPSQPLNSREIELYDQES